MRPSLCMLAGQLGLFVKIMCRKPHLLWGHVCSSPAVPRRYNYNKITSCRALWAGSNIDVQFVSQHSIDIISLYSDQLWVSTLGMVHYIRKLFWWVLDKSTCIEQGSFDSMWISLNNSSKLTHKVCELQRYRSLPDCSIRYVFFQWSRSSVQLETKIWPYYLHATMHNGMSYHAIDYYNSKGSRLGRFSFFGDFSPLQPTKNLLAKSSIKALYFNTTCIVIRQTFFKLK